MLRNDLFRPWFVGEADWGVEIIDGSFSGVSLQITSIEFANSADGSVQLDYNIIHKPEHLTDEELKSDLFSKTLELIINDILKEAVEDAKQSRDHDSQESST